MKVGEYIRSARKERGLAQADLAKRCQVSGAEISRIESGKRAASPRILKVIAEALVIDYSHLMHLAGYIEETTEEEKAIQPVFVGQNGENIDIVTGAREMFRIDAAWANAAYWVSCELSDSDREIIKEMVMIFLEKRRKEDIRI